MEVKPEITISSLDADRLYELIESLSSDEVTGIEELEEELDRAHVVEPNEMPPDVVTMNSTVKLVVVATKEEFDKKLVYPKSMDSSGQMISILAPVGSAILGLSQGDEIEWPKPDGGYTKVKIKEITYQPERAGEMHL